MTVHLIRNRKDRGTCGIARLEGFGWRWGRHDISLQCDPFGLGRLLSDVGATILRQPALQLQMATPRTYERFADRVVDRYWGQEGAERAIMQQNRRFEISGSTDSL